MTTKTAFFLDEREEIFPPRLQCDALHSPLLVWVALEKAVYKKAASAVVSDGDIVRSPLVGDLRIKQLGNRDLYDFELDDALWNFYLNNVAHFVAEQSLSNRCATADFTLAQVGLAFAHDGVLHRHTVLHVFHFHGRENLHSLVAELAGVNDLCVCNSFL